MTLLESSPSDPGIIPFRPKGRAFAVRWPAAEPCPCRDELAALRAERRRMRQFIDALLRARASRAAAYRQVRKERDDARVALAARRARIACLIVRLAASEAELEAHRIALSDAGRG